MPARRHIGISLEFHLLYKRHSEIFAGVLRYADEQEWVTVNDDWVEGTLAHATPEGVPFDGVIARVDGPRLGLIKESRRLGMPLVNVLANSPAFDQLPGAFPDFEQVGRLRAEHLMSRGLRHFACPAIKNHAADQREAAAFAATVEAAGLSVTRLDLHAKWGDTLVLYQKNKSTIHRWMDGWELPIGVASSTDVFARHMAQMSLERGWKIPEDVAIIGGQNEEKLCERPRPALSSVEVGYERVGYEAAKLLDRLMADAARRRMRGRPSTPKGRPKPAAECPEHVILPPVSVVVRESTDFYAGNDELVSRAQAFIAEHCHTPMEVNDVAANVRVSGTKLQARFAEVLRRTVAQEIRRVRIEKAKRELTNSECPIHEIARRAGFTSNARLCDVFQRDVGVSPSEYRKQRAVPKPGP